MTSPLLPDLAFTVAITGHRAIGAGVVDDVQAHIGDILAAAASDVAAARSANPLDAQRSLHLRFVSGMAEGADQIGFRAAKAAPGWRAEAVLPFDRETFLQTFIAFRQGADTDQARAARAQFDALLADTPVLELADWTWDGHADADRANEYWRARRYVTLGQMLVRRADLVIAVWNGMPPEMRGGTAEVVAEARRAGVPIVWLHAETLELRSFVADAANPRQFPIGQPMEASRAGSAAAIAAAVHNVLLGADARRGAAIAAFHHAERLPRWQMSDGREFPGTGAWPYAMMLWLLLRDDTLYKKPFLAARRLPASRNRLIHALRWPWVLDIGFWENAKLGHEATPAGHVLDQQIAAATCVDAVLEPYVRHADAVATRLGHHYRSGYLMVFVLAAAAVFLAGLWLIYPNGKPLFVLLELATIVGAIGLWARMSQRGLRGFGGHLRIKGRDTHQRWLDARLISENLRNAQILSWIGFSGRSPMEEAAPPDAEHGGGEIARPAAHGHKHASQRAVWTPWLASAQAAIPPIPTGAMTPARIGLIARALRHVIEGQHQYHRRNGARLEKLHERLDIVGLAGVGLGVIASALFLLLWLWGGVHSVIAAGSPGGIAAKVWAWICHWNDDERAEWLHPWGYAAAFFGSFGPAAAAAMASIRYHGDYERFAKRSEETAAVLLRLKRRADDLVHRSGDSARAMHAGNPPIFEDLLELMLDTQDVLDKDLLDWRFAYGARPMPLP